MLSQRVTFFAGEPRARWATTVLVTVFVVVMALVALAAVFAGAALAKPVTIASYGSGPGQVVLPTSVAVNQSTHDLYVADDKNFRIDKFGPSGEFISFWGAQTVNTQNNFNEPLGPWGLAVDQSAPGDVWTSSEYGLLDFGLSGEAMPEISGVRGYLPLAVDAAGDVWVGEGQAVQELNPSGAHKATVALPGVGDVVALAVTPSGDDIYVIGREEAGVREFETATGDQVGGTIDEAGEPQAIALDSAGDLYVGGELKSSAGYSFKEYDPAGVQVEEFGTGQVLGDPGRPPVTYGGSDGIAVDSTAAVPVLYSASDEEGSEEAGGRAENAVQRFVLPGRGPLPEGEEATAVQPTSVAIGAFLNPENHTTKYRFEYGTQPGVYSQHTTELTLTASAFAAEAVHADLVGLSPATKYYYRLTATNNCNEAVPAEVCMVSGEGESFTTLPAVDVESESAKSVTSDSASFEGVLNPLGVEARWWVECATGEGVFRPCSASEPLPAGSSGVVVSTHVQGLLPSTVYEYRFVASDVREGASLTSYGESLSFTTQSGEPSSALPDGRVWEMVSPLDKQDAAPVGLANEGGLVQAAANGDGISWLATASIEASTPGEPGPEWSQILSRHGGGGWSSRDITSPHEQEWPPIAGKLSEFFAFSPDLSVGLVEPKGETLLGGASERTPYLRQNADCENGVSAPGCYVPLVTTENVTSGEKWGGPTNNTTGAVSYSASTPDLGHVVLNSDVSLKPGAGSHGLYEWSAGQLQLVSMLPGASETPACEPSMSKVGNSVSSDGDRVIFAGEEHCGEGAAHLYMREVAGDRTVQLDVGSSGGGGDPIFQDASANGSRVFFTDGERLTADSYANGVRTPDLFVYEANPDSDPEPGVLRDVTVSVHAGESADVIGAVPGVSEDGSVAYVVAGGVLSSAANEYGEVALSGQPNLYRVERAEGPGGAVSWVASFIATLANEGGGNKGDASDWTGLLTARVSTNGQWLTFMSERPLTGYDNRDVVSGARDEEVFLYDASGRRLVCASCDPSGARPHGLVPTFTSLIDSQHVWYATHRWLAGMIPVANTQSAGEAVYQPRYLSDSGRLFFDSADALVPQDVNDTVDVYQYEPPGVGSCTTGSETYSARQAGCIGLISSGISSLESTFLDASENGNDVFFLTAGKLVAKDTDSAYDVYDAHVCGSAGAGEAEWACSPPGAVSPPCSNTSSCRGAPEPQPMVFGAPASATFSGAGNITPVPVPVVSKQIATKSVKCKKGFVKKQGKCVKNKAKKTKGKAKASVKSKTKTKVKAKKSTTRRGGSK